MKSIYDLPPLPSRNNLGAGKVKTETIKAKRLRAMVGALESVGLVVRLSDEGHTVCRVNGQELLHAAKGRNSTYLTRYAEGVTRLMGKK